MKSKSVAAGIENAGLDVSKSDESRPQLSSASIWNLTRKTKLQSSGWYTGSAVRCGRLFDITQGETNGHRNNPLLKQARLHTVVFQES
jgi:hypothetical protein